MIATKPGSCFSLKWHFTGIRIAIVKIKSLKTILSFLLKFHYLISVFALTQNLRVQHWKDGSGTRNFKCRCVLGTQKLSRQKYQVNKPLSITISPLRSTDWQFIPGHFHFAVDHLSPCRLFLPMQPRLFLSPTCRRLGLCYVGLIE